MELKILHDNSSYYLNFQNNISYIIFDNYNNSNYGKLIREYYKKFKDFGYDIKVLNLFNPNKSDNFNPFCYLKDDLDVITFSKFLIEHDNLHLQSQLLSALMLYLKNNNDLDEDCKSFTSVMKLLRTADVNENDPNAKSPLDLIFEKVELENPNSLSSKSYKSFKYTPCKERKHIISKYFDYLSIFDDKKIARMTTYDTLNLNNFLDRPSVLFVEIPTNKAFDPIVTSLKFVIDKLFNCNQNFDEFVNINNDENEYENTTINENINENINLIEEFINSQDELIKEQKKHIELQKEHIELQNEQIGLKNEQINLQTDLIENFKTFLDEISIKPDDSLNEN